MISMWLARDQNGRLYMYEQKPMKSVYGFIRTDGKSCIVAKGMFPEVTYENSPVQVEVKLIEDEAE